MLNARKTLKARAGEMSSDDLCKQREYGFVPFQRGKLGRTWAIHTLPAVCVYACLC